MSCFVPHTAAHRDCASTGSSPSREKENILLLLCSGGRFFRNEQMNIVGGEPLHPSGGYPQRPPPVGFSGSRHP
jgi:hypothetical protein